MSRRPIVTEWIALEVALLDLTIAEAEASPAAVLWTRPYHGRQRLGVVGRAKFE